MYEIQDLISRADANIENSDDLPPTPINLTPTRLDMLDQYDEEDSFFIKKLRCNFIVNKVFAASISLRQIRENNLFKKHVFVAKKANFWT